MADYELHLIGSPTHAIVDVNGTDKIVSKLDVTSPELDAAMALLATEQDLATAENRILDLEGLVPVAPFEWQRITKADVSHCEWGLDRVSKSSYYKMSYMRGMKVPDLGKLWMNWYLYTTTGTGYLKLITDAGEMVLDWTGQGGFTAVMDVSAETDFSRLEIEVQGKHSTGAEIAVRCDYAVTTIAGLQIDPDWDEHTY